MILSGEASLVSVSGEAWVVSGEASVVDGEAVIEENVTGDAVNGDSVTGEPVLVNGESDEIAIGSLVGRGFGTRDSNGVGAIVLA